MVDVFRVADLLVSHALRNHAEDVDIIGYYGSYAQGTATIHSDLDIFYIPAEGKNPNVARAFLIDGILFDFWGISWDTMQGFATGRIRGWSYAPAIVHHAKILHARSEQQAARFADLKQQVLDLQKPDAKPQMVGRALDMFKFLLAHQGNLRLSSAGDDFADVRHAGWKVILSAMECLALANQVFFDKGWGSILEQSSRLRCRPENLEELVRIIGTSADPGQISGAADRLVLGTRRVLRQFQEALPSRQTVGEGFRDAYPEINAAVGKVLRACNEGRQVAASADAWHTQYDLSAMLGELRDGAGTHPDFNLYSECAAFYRELGLPELMHSDLAAGDLDGLSKQAGLLDRRIRQWLGEQSVDLSEFETLEEFERSL